MSENEDKKIVFKVLLSIQFNKHWYIKQSRVTSSGLYLPIRKFLCKNGVIIDKLIPPFLDETNYFKSKEDAIDVIHEFYSVIEVIE